MKYYLLLIAAILVISCKEKKHPITKHIIINGEHYAYISDTDIIFKKDTVITGWRVQNGVITIKGGSIHGIPLASFKKDTAIDLKSGIAILIRHRDSSNLKDVPIVIDSTIRLKRDTVFINKKGYTIINHSGLPTLVIDRRN